MNSNKIKKNGWKYDPIIITVMKNIKHRKNRMI